VLPLVSRPSLPNITGGRSQGVKVKNKEMKLTAIIIELVGIATVGAGIGLELGQGGDVYLVMITVGSVLVAGGGFLWSKVYHRK